MQNKPSHQARLLKEKVVRYFHSVLLTPKEEKEAHEALDNTIELYNKIVAEDSKK